MSAYLFVGPTLPRDEIRATDDFVCLPPVAQGDVYRLVQRRPRAIGIIDGYFEGAPAVWHKEILYALAEGVHVFGGASMGALRAAELHPFGMRGVGRIFESYREGLLTHDDEVAVLHGPAELAYTPLSEAMVNVRATLEHAEADGVIAGATKNVLERLAKGMFYQDRSWPALLGHPEAQALPGGVRDILQSWLPEGRIDQKRADALAMLDAMRDLLATDAEPIRLSWRFEWTGMWAAALPAWSSIESAGNLAPLAPARLLDELRLARTGYAEIKRAALLRLLARRAGDLGRIEPDRQEVGAAASRLRARHGLFTKAQLDCWLAANGLELAAFERLIEEEARISTLQTMLGPALEEAMVDELRLGDLYPGLLERARRKQALLAERGLEDTDPTGLGVAPARLLAWYVEGRLRQPLPHDVQSFARELGFADAATFYRALAREYAHFVCGEDGCDQPVATLGSTQTTRAGNQG